MTARAPRRSHYFKSGMNKGSLRNDEAADRRKCKNIDCKNQFWAWPGAPEEYCLHCQADHPEWRPKK